MTSPNLKISGDPASHKSLVCKSLIRHSPNPKMDTLIKPDRLQMPAKYAAMPVPQWLSG